MSKAKYTIVFQREVLGTPMLALRRVRAEEGLPAQDLLEANGLDSGIVLIGWPRQPGEEDAEEA